MHQIPNIISILRAILVLPIGILLYKEIWTTAFALIFIAGISDGIDGYLARKYQWQSRLGSILDPLADKLLIVIIFIIFAHKGIIPNWLTSLIIVRDIIILSGAVSYQWLTRDLVVSPLLSSKINTALQIVFVLGLMLHLTFMPLPEIVLSYAQLTIAAIAIISGYHYISCWSKYTINFSNKREQKQ